MLKSTLFLITAVLISTYPVFSQAFTVTNLNLPVKNADVSVVDIDGDGDLDIVISGENGEGRNLQVFKNNGTGTFTAASSPFKPVTRTTFDWNDINGDGKLDLIMSGFTAPGISGAAFDSVYTSDGAGNFTRANIATPQLAPSTGFADLNNDGYTDIYVFGNINSGPVKPRILFNNKAGGFIESAQFEAYEFLDPEVTIVDFDNDKDLDIFVNAFERVSNKRFSRMFVNDGSGTFTEKNLGLIEKGYGSAIWGDYNGDGFLDLLLNGDGDLSSGEPSNNIYRLYRNNAAATFTAVTTFQPYRQISTGDGGRFADWDNDGDLDIIVTGYNDAEQREATAIFLNNAGTFTAMPNNANLPGVSESSIEVADIDGDTDLDLLLTGYSANNYNGPGSAFNTNVSLIVRNPTTVTNAAPAAPTNLSISGTSASLTFSWNAATDATTPQNSLSYNMFLVNDQGRTFYFPLADTTTGKLSLQRLGNVQLNRGWIVKGLPAGNYRWGVQAIDNSFMGSPFAKTSFAINANGTVLPIILSSFTVKPENNKARIEWSTATEQGNDRFEVERSADGINFTRFATVKGNGTTSAANQYFVYDNSPLEGTNYYRLIQYNMDGRNTNYGIRTANFRNLPGATLAVYPNPVIKDLGIRLNNYSGKQVAVTLTDMSGKMIYREVIQTSISQSDYNLNVKNKPFAGQYILKVSGEGLNKNVNVLVK